MSFSISGNNIVQTAGTTDTSLSGIPSTFVTTAFDGLVTTYTLNSDLNIQVEGNLTINPEREKLIGNFNNAIDIRSGGTLQLGGIEETTVGGTTFRRYLRGVAVRCNLAPVAWFGFNNSYTINTRSGGTFILQGATVQVPGNFSAVEGSTLYIEDGYMIVDDTPPSDTSGVVEPLTLPARGYISAIFADDVSINNLYFLNGGEMLLRSQVDTSLDSGVGSILTIDGTLIPKRKFSGYSPSFAKQPLFASQVPSVTLNNTDISRKANIKDVALQTNNQTNVTTILNNTNGGTAVRIIASESGSDIRSRGVARVLRETDFNIKTLAGDDISGGRVFMRDTNNGLRTALYANGDISTLSPFGDAAGNPLPGFTSNIFDDRADNIYTDTIVNGNISSPFDILLGSVKVPGTERHLLNDTNDPAANSSTNLPWRWDLRGETNVPGEDRFTFHVWHPEYSYLPVTISLAAGVPAITQDIILLKDAFYANTQFSNNQITTLSGIYDYIKVTKSSNATQMELPTVSALHIAAAGRTIDLGNYGLVPGNTEYLEVDSVNEILTVNATTLAPTDIFNSITTTGNIDVDLLDATKTYNLTSNILYQADDFMDFPSKWVLNGTIHFDDPTTKQLNFPIDADTSDVSLLRTDGDVTVRGRGREAFASVVGDISFVVEMTITSDFAGDITIYNTAHEFTSPSAFDHHINVNTVVKFDASPGDSFIAVIGIPGRVGIPVAFTASDRSQTVKLSSTSLDIFGYDSTVDIGTQIQYSIATPPYAIDNGRYILTALQTGGDFDYSDTDRNSKFFGDLYGAKNSAETKNLMNEVILHNYDLTRDTEIFTLNPISTIVSVNLPLFRASYDTVVPAMPYRFRADPVTAKIINSDYIFIITRNAIASFTEASGVFNQPNIIGALSSSMNMAADTITDALVENDIQTTANATNLISFEFEQQTRLGA